MPDYDQLYRENLVIAKKAFRRFCKPLCLELYDLLPTENIGEVIFNHVQRMMCFFNIDNHKPVPYLFAVEIKSQWYSMPVKGELTPTSQLWLASFEHATPTVGYIDIYKTGDGWLKQEVLP